MDSWLAAVMRLLNVTNAYRANRISKCAYEYCIKRGANAYIER